MRKLRWMTIAWPAFLMTSVLEILVFSMVGPQDFLWLAHTLAWSNEAIYTVMFFVMWAITSVACALTALLSLTAEEVNQT